jgi:hypothetical protein
MTFRSRPLLDLAYKFPCSLNFPGCEGGDAGEPAHSNQAKHGKGGAMKAHDCFHVPACRSCHRELDQGRMFSKEMKFAEWDRAYGLYLPRLFESGYLTIKGDK